MTETTNGTSYAVGLERRDLRPLEVTTPAPLKDSAVRLVAAFVEGRNARTRRAYVQDLEVFARFVGLETLPAAAARLLGGGAREGNLLVLEYRAELVRRGLAPATVARRLAALRALVKLAGMLELVTWELEVRGPKVETYRDTRGPGREGVRRLLDALEGRTDRKARRDRAILHLLYDLGLRRGEVVGLDVADVDLGAGTLAVLGKGRSGKARVTMPAETQVALRAWLDARGRVPGALFVNLDRGHGHRRLDGRSVHRLVERLGAAAGIIARPHGLRHAAITEALAATNGNVQAVARFSRHKDPRTVLAYDDNRQDLGGEVARLVVERTHGKVP